MAEQQQRERRSPPARPPPPQTSSQAQAARPLSSSSQNVESGIHTFADLQSVCDMAFSLTDAGLQADERGDIQVATDSYLKGLQLLDRALRVNCEQLSQCTRDQIDQAKDMQMKMNKTRQQITFRLQLLQAEQANAYNQQDLTEANAPPSYEQAMSEPPCTPPAYDDDELNALGESLMRREISSSHLADAADLFCIEDGVQIFYITPDGFVSAPSYPTSLHIIRLENEPQMQGPHGETPPAFLHVGDWVYPLVPGTSPVLQTNYGAYVFPDMMASRPGYAVGLVLPETLSAEERQTFLDILNSCAVLGIQSPATTPEAKQISGTEVKLAEETKKEEVKEADKDEVSLDTADKISRGILVAADWIAWGVGKGAEKAGELIKLGSEKIRERTKPAEQPHKINLKIQKGVIYTRKATHGAVKVTGYIVNKLGEVTVALAKEVAPHVRKHGSKIIPKSLTAKKEAEGKSTLDGVMQVAASGLKGFGTVYLGLEKSAKSLGKSLTNETVHVVRHKYGDEAGEFTENTMYTTGNVIMTAHNARNLGVKAIAKRTAKETGKAVLEDASRSSSAGASANGDNTEGRHVSDTDKRQHPDQKSGPK